MIITTIIFSLFGILLFVLLSIIIYFVRHITYGKPIEIDAKNYKLKGRLYVPKSIDNTKPKLLFLSGWNPGNQPITTSDYFAGYLMKKAGYVCLTVALRGNGSNGDINILTRNDFLNDVIAAYDYLLTNEPVNLKKICVIGESFGSYMASILSREREIENLILRVPTDFPNEGFYDKPHINYAGFASIEWKRQVHSYEESFALQAIHNFNRKILIIASENDKIVPMQTTKNYLNAANKSINVEHKVQKNTGHAIMNPVKFIEFRNIIFHWLTYKSI